MSHSKNKMRTYTLHNIYNALELGAELESPAGEAFAFSLSHPISMNFSAIILHEEKMTWSSEMQMQSPLKMNCQLP